jgi:hypothetical protein
MKVFRDGKIVDATPAEIAELKEAEIRSRDDFPAFRVNAECRRRILAVVGETHQINLASSSASGWPDAETQAERDDLAATYILCVRWIAAMRAKSKALIRAKDRTFVDDSHWPDPAPEIALLVDKF